MKAMLFVFLVGFIGHKVIHEVYEYYWWKNSKYCYDLANDIEPYVPKGIETREQCFKEKLGFVAYLPLVLLRPKIGKNKYFSMSYGWGI